MRKKRTRLSVLLAVCLILAMLPVWAMAAEPTGTPGEGNGGMPPEGGERKEKTIMIFSPHQDDEANMANAIMYAHQKRGDQVYVVMAFGSVGNRMEDTYGQGRLQESKRNLQTLGIPANHLIYLGYQKIDHEIHYRGGPAQLDETGALLWYRTGEPYLTYGGKETEYPSYHYQKYGEQWTVTEDHLKSDLKDVIKEYRPDELYVINYDNHLEHMYLGSMVDTAFGEVLAELAKQGEVYQPRYYQSMSYQTAWGATADLDRSVSPSDGKRVFLESTLPVTPRNPTFSWADRVRFPVEEEMSTPSLETNLSAQAYVNFRNRGGVSDDRIRSCVNGDQVVWERDCRSIAYDATVTVSSNEAEAGQLKDFSTLRMHMKDFLTGSGALKFNDYLWSAAPDDSKPWVRLTFPEPRDIASVKLYDDYSADNQILAGTLVFSDSSTIPIEDPDDDGLTRPISVGPLNDDGSATLIAFDQKEDIEWVEFQIDRYRGTAGLSEFEVYGWGEEQELRLVNQEGEPEGIELCWLGPERKTDFIQIILDEVEGKDWANKSFLYRYPIDATEQTRTLRLGVYAYPDSAEIIGDTYRWALEGGVRQGITVTQDGLLTVTGEAETGEYTVTATSTKNPALTDSVILDVKGCGAPRETFTLSGSFQGPEDETRQSSDCIISVYRADGSFLGSQIVPTTEQKFGVGSYAISGIPAGRYDLVFQQKNGASLKISDVTVSGDRDLGLVTLVFLGKADRNGDGVIDFKDIAIVLMGMDGYGRERADVNGDGKVDRSDLEAVLDKFY